MLLTGARDRAPALQWFEALGPVWGRCDGKQGHLAAAGRRRGRVGIAGRRDGGVADRLADCDVARGGRPRQTSSWAAAARGRGEGEGGGRHAGWEARVSGIRSADRR